MQASTHLSTKNEVLHNNVGYQFRASKLGFILGKGGAGGAFAPPWDWFPPPALVIG